MKGAASSIYSKRGTIALGRGAVLAPPLWRGSMTAFPPGADLIPARNQQLQQATSTGSGECASLKARTFQGAPHPSSGRRRAFAQMVDDRITNLSLNSSVECSKHRLRVYFQEPQFAIVVRHKVGSSEVEFKAIA
jgi:hypothetical protein